MNLIEADAARVAARVDLSPLNGKTVCILGATGLIGSHIKAAIETTGAIIYTWDMGRECDYVIHAAGYAQPSKFMADPFATVLVNTQGTAAMLRLVKPGGKFLFLSSAEVYSGSQNSPHTEDDIGRTDPSHPRACYIEGKRGGESLVHAGRRSGMDGKIARVALAYGPGVKQDDTRVMSDLIRQGLSGHVALRDSGVAQRTYLYVADCVEMLLNILLYGKEVVYNVAGNSHTTILMLAEQIRSLTGAEMKWQDSPPDGAAPQHVQLSIERYVREFGRPEFLPFTEGLKRSIEWQRNL